MTTFWDGSLTWSDHTALSRVSEKHARTSVLRVLVYILHSCIAVLVSLATWRRRDRDNYVRVNTDQIQSRYRSKYEIETDTDFVRICRALTFRPIFWVWNFAKKQKNIESKEAYEKHRGLGIPSMEASRSRFALFLRSSRCFMSNSLQIITRCHNTALTRFRSYRESYVGFWFCNRFSFSSPVYGLYIWLLLFLTMQRNLTSLILFLKHKRTMSLWQSHAFNCNLYARILLVVASLLRLQPAGVFYGMFEGVFSCCCVPMPVWVSNTCVFYQRHVLWSINAKM